MAPHGLISRGAAVRWRERGLRRVRYTTVFAVALATAASAVLALTYEAATPGVSVSAAPLLFAGRVTGTVALVLLTASVVIGIADAGRYAPQALGRFEVAALHRNVSLLAMVFLTVHIVTTLALGNTLIGWVSSVVPFIYPYRPLWVGLGTLAFDVVAAVALTSAVRLRMGRRRWKAVHWASYVAWLEAVLHSAGTGADTALGGQFLMLVLCVGAVAATCWWRLAIAGPGHVAARVSLAVLVGVLPVLFYVFLIWGPLASNWVMRAAAP